MKKIIQTFAVAACALAVVGVARAQDTVAGKWKSQFDSQIGQQNYIFEFKVDGTNVTGTATGERQMGTNTVAITEGKITKDGVFFVEPLKLQDNDIRIEYSGKVSGDELKLHRKVGDFAEYDIVAKRVKAGDAASSETKPETNAPPPKP